MDTDNKKWYIIHTRTLFEEKVRNHINKEISNNPELSERFGEIVIPTEEVIEIRKNKKYITKRKFFPGYILIKLALDNETFWVVKNTPGVTGFLGGLKPTSIPESEAAKLIDAMSVKEGAKPKLAISFIKDENVRIMDGPFANFVGVVDEINQEKGKLTVMVTIFGRSTPVVVDFLQVEKI